MKTFITVISLLSLLCSFSPAQSVDSDYLDVGKDKIFYEAAGEEPVLVGAAVGGLTVTKHRYNQGGQMSIQVPEVDGEPVLLDGLFSPGEWEKAKKIDILPNVTLYLKQSNGHVFMGVKITPFQTASVNLFFSTDGKNILQLHTSAQIGERLVHEDSGRSDNPSFIWGNSSEWYANEIRWDYTKMQELMKQGKDRNEAQEMSFFKYEGFEFQIKKSKFSSDFWMFRIDVPMAPDFDKPVIWPKGTEMKSTKGWVRLELR